MNKSLRKHIQYMKLCISAASIFSTCGKKQYAAILVDEHGHIIGFGYNGGPSGHVHCKDGGCERLKQDSPSGSNYDNCISIHAEANALLHSDYSARAKKIYVNGPPCFNCAKLIVNSTVQELYYLHDPDYSNWDKVKYFLISSNINIHRISSGSL